MAKAKNNGRRAKSGPRKKSGVFREYKFVIDAYSPETFPMGRLAEYLGELATLVGQDKHVHFSRLASGSTGVVHRVEWEAVPKYHERLRAVKTHDKAPAEAVNAFRALNLKLIEDNASGRLVEVDGDSDRKILDFPGRRGVPELQYGPFNQTGDLVGTVIMVGGKNDPVPVHLQDGDRTYLCEAKRDTARDLAKFLFGVKLRVSGLGRWFRDSEGAWEMKSFRITSYAPLAEGSIRDVVGQMRQVPGAWRNSTDVLADVDKVRKA